MNYRKDIGLKTNFDKIYCENDSEELDGAVHDVITSFNAKYKDFEINFYPYLASTAPEEIWITVSAINEDFDIEQWFNNYAYQKEICDKLNEILENMNAELKDKFSLPDTLFYYKKKKCWVCVDSNSAHMQFISPQILERVNNDEINWDDYWK